MPAQRPSLYPDQLAPGCGRGRVHRPGLQRTRDHRRCSVCRRVRGLRPARTGPGSAPCRRRGDSRVRLLRSSPFGATRARHRGSEPRQPGALHFRHHRTPQGGGSTCGVRVRAHAFTFRRGLRSRQGPASPVHRTPVPCGPVGLFAHASALRRRGRRTDGSLGQRGGAATDPGASDHALTHGADHVSPVASFARRGPKPLRRFLSHVHRARRSALSAEHQAGPNQLGGADRVGILCGHGRGRHHGRS